MWSQDATAQGRGGEAIINFQSPKEGYRGLGFYLSSQRTRRVASTRIINGRVVVVRLKALSEGNADLVVVNVHGPTMMRAKENPEATEALYRQLSQTGKEEKRGVASAFTLGDFNAKIGKSQDDESKLMGKRGKGERDENGEELQRLLAGDGARLANAHFKRRDRQAATWRKTRPQGEASKKR